MQKYRIVTEVFVETETRKGEPPFWEKAASIGHVVEANSFAESLSQFNKHLNDQWAKVAQMAPVIDGEDRSPETEGDATTG